MQSCWFRYIASMNHLALACESLRNAEASLRDLAAKAATDGDYASVMQIASWAQAVKEISSGTTATHENRAGIAAANCSRRVVTQTKLSKRPKRKEHTSEYPKFFRRGDQLVRIAWSKRDDAEYQHKTSFAVLKQLAEMLTSVGTEGRIFSTDEILPVQDQDGRPIPTYQAYVCIAFLKQAGLIDQHGRQGYSLACGNDIKNAVDSIWETIPDRLPQRPR